MEGKNIIESTVVDLRAIAIENLRNEYELDNLEMTEHMLCNNDSRYNLQCLIDLSKVNEPCRVTCADEKKKAIGKPKRGRKQVRPSDPIKIKTEEKDKFWLRAFRSNIRTIISCKWNELVKEEEFFWKFYFSVNGKPGKKRRFLSYCKKYKDFLFSSQFFKSKFCYWFANYGREALLKKYNPGSNEWFVYYDYCETELIKYNDSQLVKIHLQPHLEDQHINMVDDLLNLSSLT